MFPGGYWWRERDSGRWGKNSIKSIKYQLTFWE